MPERLYSARDVREAASEALGKVVEPWHVKHLLRAHPELRPALWLSGRMVFTEAEKEGVVRGLWEGMR